MEPALALATGTCGNEAGVQRPCWDSWWVPGAGIAGGCQVALTTHNQDSRGPGQVVVWEGLESLTQWLFTKG